MARINIMASKKIISKIAIVGFDESEASLLLSFLFNYDVDFKKKTDKEITDQYPLCKNIWDSLNNMAINLVKTKDVPNNERQLGKFSIIAVKYRTKKQTLFYHLRNAIAHGKIYKDDKYVHFTDWNPWQKHESAIGRIKNSDFENRFRIRNYSNTKH